MRQVQVLAGFSTQQQGNNIRNKASLHFLKKTPVFSRYCCFLPTRWLPWTAYCNDLSIFNYRCTNWIDLTCFLGQLGSVCFKKSPASFCLFDKNSRSTRGGLTSHDLWGSSMQNSRSLGALHRSITPENQIDHGLVGSNADNFGKDIHCWLSLIDIQNNSQGICHIIGEYKPQVVE